MVRKLLVVLVLCVVINAFCHSKELIDFKLGSFQIEDTKAEKTYTGFPEVSASIGKLFNGSIYAGLELDYFLLPENYNLWGNTTNSKVQVFKSFINCGWIIQQGNGFSGFIAGYDFGINIFSSLIGGQKVGDVASWKLMYTKGIIPKKWEDKNRILVFDAGVQNTPGCRLFVRFGILFETNIFKGLK